MSRALTIILPFLLLSAARGQLRPIPTLQQYLELADSQVQAILRNNDDYNHYAQEKQRRMAQVQREIAEETAKEWLDSAALGIRYAEIEVHCRQLKEEAEKILRNNLDVLNDAQKAKLKVLEEAMKLMPAISEAEWTNLLGTYQRPPYFFNSSSTRTDGLRLGVSIPGVPACTQTQAVINPWIDTGEFQPPQS